jgi:hypothetical protein
LKSWIEYIYDCDEVFMQGMYERHVQIYGQVLALGLSEWDCSFAQLWGNCARKGETCGEVSGLGFIFSGFNFRR